MMPWGTILMVCGVTVLIALMGKTGGMELFTSLLAKFSTTSTVTAVIAFVTGVISVYSSSSGVVLPAFLPTIPGLVARLGGGDPLAIASSINVGAHLVDLSPLSTLGALCLANAPPSEDRTALFYKLLIWGLSMCASAQWSASFSSGYSSDPCAPTYQKTTSRSRSARIISGLRPSSHKTSSVCCPRVGAGRRICPGVRDSLTGRPRALVSPAVGWSRSTTISLA